MATLAGRTALSNAYDDFLQTFSNVLFAVSLFVVWGVMTLIGVLVDQGKDPTTYFATLPAPLARLILRLGFDNIYHSIAYVGIIGLILVSLAVCTFKRVIPARLPALRPVSIEHIPLNASVTVQGDEAGVRARVESFFKSRGWNVRKREFGGTEWTFADKQNWARRGVLVAHMGFVIIAAGTWIYWARGFAGDTAIVTGQTVGVPHTHTTIRLNGFHYTVAPILTKSGMVYQPTDYVSNVTVAGADGVPHARTLRVNHPIDVDGTLYYQSSYGFAAKYLVTHDGVRDAQLSDRVYLAGEVLQLPGSQRAVQFAQFVPTIDRATGQPSADPRLSNPGIVFDVSQAGQQLAEALVPLRTWVDAGDGWRITPQSYLLVSGVQYRYDPGVPLVGVGAFVLLAGLVISFYLLPARLYIRVEGAAGRSRIGIAATTVKGYDMFEKQFADLTAELREVT